MKENVLVIFAFVFGLATVSAEENMLSDSRSTVHSAYLVGSQTVKSANKFNTSESQQIQENRRLEGLKTRLKVISDTLRRIEFEVAPNRLNDATEILKQEGIVPDYASLHGEDKYTLPDRIYFSKIEGNCEGILFVSSALSQGSNGAVSQLSFMAKSGKLKVFWVTGIIEYDRFVRIIESEC